MNKIYPPKLQSGDTIRVIAPSDAHPLWDPSIVELAEQRFKDLGLKVTYSKNINEVDMFESSSIQSRVDDLHEAFLDENIKMVIASDGGWTCNQILRYIDWDIVRDHPKIFCGFSDITALDNAIFAKTGLVTYSSPNFGHFGKKIKAELQVESFKRCLFSDEPYDVEPSKEWSDDKWYKDQDNRAFMSNGGYFVINEGEATGTSLGGNQCTVNLLQGTEYMPDLTDSILFLEDDNEVQPKTFDRDLQSLIHLPDFSSVRGIIIGRFEIASNMTNDLLKGIIKSKKELDHLPVIANVDFGHTDPKITFPIGGEVRMVGKKDHSRITIIKH